MTALEKAILRTFDIAPGAGAIQSGVRLMGEFDERDLSAEFRLRKLTVAPIQPYAEQITATITLPGGIIVGPIDLPFSYNITSPAQVIVFAPNLTSPQSIQLILANLPDSPNLYSATHVVVDGSGGTLFPIPDACVAISNLANTAVITFYNSTPAAIGTASGSQLIARPRTAKFVSTSLAGAIVFHY